jgi:hypothetical protein
MDDKIGTRNTHAIDKQCIWGEEAFHRPYGTRNDININANTAARDSGDWVHVAQTRNNCGHDKYYITNFPTAWGKKKKKNSNFLARWVTASLQLTQLAAILTWKHKGIYQKSRSG